MKQKSAQIAALATICLLAAAALSSPGRTTIRHLMARITESPAGGSNDAAVQASANADLLGRARARHGWNHALVNSVARGRITYYDRNGAAIDEARVTVYRGYPNRLRVEMNRGGAVETVGFNGSNAWQAGASELSPERARDIRAWLRAWPDRMFVSRDSGAISHEIGARSESFKPGRPWQAPIPLRAPVSYRQVVLEDTLVPAAAGQVGDRRMITYSIHGQTATIEAARWLEPDNPLRAITDAKTSKLDVRVEFGDWQRTGAVLWPQEIVHWLGGKVDYRIRLDQVELNQPLADAIFQRQ